VASAQTQLLTTRERLQNAIAELGPKHALIILGSLTAFAAILRFSTLDLQSFWNDEAGTAFIVAHQHSQMLALTHHETTPPTYYVFMWVWAKVFGNGELGLRSVSALAGTVCVPIAYLAGRELSTVRVGLFAAALATFNPLLIWYSQEARPYALLVMAGGLSFLAFVYAFKYTRPITLIAWSLASVLALCVHYFAIFLIIPEAAFLLAKKRQMPTVFLAVWTVGATAALLFQYALRQRSQGGTNWIATTTPLWHRALQLPEQFLNGFYQSSLQRAGGVVCLVLVVFALWLLARRSDPAERRGGMIAGAVGVTAIAIAVFLEVFHQDLLVSRNFLAALLPIALLVATGFGVRRAGWMGVAGLVCVCAISLATVAAVDTNASLQRSDWRGIAQKLGVPTAPRLLVVTDTLNQGLGYYKPHAKAIPPQGAWVGEIDLIRGTGPMKTACWWGATCYVPGTVPPRIQMPSPDFKQTQTVTSGGLEIVRFQSPKPIYVSNRLLLPDGSRSRGGISIVPVLDKPPGA
jgi:mannosyltransferase